MEKSPKKMQFYTDRLYEVEETREKNVYIDHKNMEKQIDDPYQALFTIKKSKTNFSKNENFDPNSSNF